MDLENEELKQIIKILEEENARLRGELEVQKVNELHAISPTYAHNQTFSPTTQKMDREKDNNKNDTCCCFICCTGDNGNNGNRKNNWNYCCCCCCEGSGGSDSGGCECGCDD